MQSRNVFVFILGMTMLGLWAGAAHAELRARYNADARDEPRNATILRGDPPSLRDLQEQTKSEAVLSKKSSGDKLENAVAGEKDLALKIRRDSMRESALSFGARGGLAWRTKAIMDELRANATAMDKAYDFRRLLIKAPSNMFIEPPIVSEAMNNFLVTPDGGEAAVADTIYQITRQARIVANPRNWRQYLERSWTVVAPPPDILLPENAEEREAWRRWVAEGWAEGIKQADEIFQADLNRMIADFEGMVRYRVLLAENKITAPFATMVDRGVSSVETPMMIGNKPIKITSEMRVGDRAIRITEPVSLRPGEQGGQWDPPIQVAP